MKLAILTPNRLQSNLLINNLSMHGIRPDLVLYYKQSVKTNVYQQTVKWSKNCIKTIFFFNAPAQKVKRIKKRNVLQAEQNLVQWANDNKIPKESYAPAHCIHDVNGTELVNLLKENDIDILFVWGIPILKPHVIDAVKRFVINAHSSILPEYRGTGAEFWQFVNDDFANAGITLHQVNTGVDTGEILQQAAAEKSDCESPELLRMMNAKRVIENTPILLKKMYKGIHHSIAQETLPVPKTRTYRSKDVTIKELKKVYLTE